MEEKSYTILDTSEDVVMLQVNHDSHTTGSLYVSDKDGVKFVRSLSNNVRSETGECEFDKVDIDDTTFAFVQTRSLIFSVNYKH